MLQSLDEQDYEDFEVIFVNDGSTDNTSIAIQQFCENPTHALNHRHWLIEQVNGGAGSARNAGLEAAVGELIFFVDGDDYIFPQTLSKLAELMTPEVDLAVGAFESSDHSLVCFPHINNREQWLQATIAKGALTLWNKMYRRSIIEDNNIRFDTTTRKSEDHLFTAEYLIHSTGRILVTDYIVYHYNWNPMSISHISMTTKTFSSWIADSVYAAARIYRLMEGKLNEKTLRELRYDSYQKYRRIRHEAHQHHCKDKAFYDGIYLEMRSIMPVREMVIFSIRRRFSIYVQSIKRKWLKITDHSHLTV